MDTHISSQATSGVRFGADVDREGGSNVKAIYTKTDAKVRIRGRGSGHLEVTHKNGRQSEAF